MRGAAASPAGTAAPTAGKGPPPPVPPRRNNTRSLDYSKWDKLAAELSDSDTEGKHEAALAAEAARKFVHENPDPSLEPPPPPPTTVLLRSNAMLEVFAAALVMSLGATAEFGLGSQAGKVLFAAVAVALYFAQARDDQVMWRWVAHIGRNVAWSVAAAAVAGLAGGVHEPHLLWAVGVTTSAVLLALRRPLAPHAPIYLSLVKEGEEDPADADASGASGDDDTSPAAPAAPAGADAAQPNES